MKALPGLKGASLLAALALAGLAGLPAAEADEALLTARCGGCHGAVEGGLSRIAGQRKTPEGWLMTIVRMRIAHGMEISRDEQAKLVAHLSETSGLAPSETEGWRYALEKQPAAVEDIEEPLASMCARCHTGARYALQRRTPEEWSLHMDFHVGQFPTVEYQALGRDRDWFRQAKEEIAPLLAERYPLETEAWTAWQAAEKPEIAGDWVVLTSLPKRGDAYGRLTVSGESSPYRVGGELRLADGTALPVEGSLNLYTGYEWRATLDVGGDSYRQVLAVSEDGQRLAGRQFLADTDSLGGELSGVRADAGPTILGTVPSNAAPGTVAVQVVGAGLDGLAAEGARVGNARPDAFGLRADLTGAGDTPVTLSSGGAEGRFAFYASIDRLAVEPDFTIARVGGGSAVGPERVPAHFRAIAFWNGPDGTAGTEDDVRIGEVPAQWSLDDANEVAEAMRDAEFAGSIGAGGIFEPAVAGPNPERPFSTNNAGDLTVRAEAGGQSAEAHLIVTVQRFIDPPIR